MIRLSFEYWILKGGGASAGMTRLKKRTICLESSRRSSTIHLIKNVILALNDVITSDGITISALYIIVIKFKLLYVLNHLVYFSIFVISNIDWFMSSNSSTNQELVKKLHSIIFLIKTFVY